MQNPTSVEKKRENYLIQNGLFLHLLGDLDFGLDLLAEFLLVPKLPDFLSSRLLRLLLVQSFSHLKQLFG
jgi:hypothetical protein